MPEEEWDELVDRIRNLADRINSADINIPDPDMDYARRHLREANRDLWKVINQLEQRIFDEQREVVSVIAGIAETHGEMFTTRLGKLIEAGIVDLKADRRRLRKAEEEVT